MQKFIDSHCHFDFPEFDEDRELVWKSCHAKGIRALVIPGVSPAQWCELEVLANHNTGYYFSVGVHPWWIAQRNKNEGLGRFKSLPVASFDQLYAQCRPYLTHPKCVAIGECGLDSTIETDMAVQVQMLEWHMRLAQTVNLPIILHCVKAQNKLIELMNAYPNVTGVVHAFTGSYQSAEQFWRRGFYLGMGGSITYERALKTRKAAKQLPMQAMVLETDAPDMPMAGGQGQRNSPVHLTDVAKVLAELRGIPLEVLAQGVYQNTLRLFPKMAQLLS